MSRSYLLIMFLIMIPGIAFGTEWYVSPTGDNQNGDGSITSPWRNLWKCANTMTPGDTCNILPGEYYEDFIHSTRGDLETALTDSATCTHGSRVITVAGSLGNIRAGQFVRCPGNPGEGLNDRVQAFFPWTEVQSVDSGAGTITLVEGYRGVTHTGTGLEAANFIRYRGLCTDPEKSECPEEVRVMAWVPETTPNLQYSQYTGDCDPDQGGDQPCQNVYSFQLPGAAGLVPNPSTTEYTGIMQAPGPEVVSWDNVRHPLGGGMGQDFGTEPFVNWNRLVHFERCRSDSALSVKLLSFVEKRPGTYFIVQNSVGDDTWYFHMRGGDNPLENRNQRDTIYIGKYRRVAFQETKFIIVDNLSHYAAWAGGDGNPLDEAEVGFLLRGLCSSADCGPVQFRRFHQHGARGGPHATLYNNSNWRNVVYEDSKFYWGMSPNFGPSSGAFNVEMRRGLSDQGHAGGPNWGEAATLDRIYATSTITPMLDNDSTLGCTSYSDIRRYDFSAGPSAGLIRDTCNNGLLLNWDVDPDGTRAKGYVLNSIWEYTADGAQWNSADVTRWYYNTGGRRAFDTPDTYEQRIRPDRESGTSNGKGQLYGNALLSEKNEGLVWFRNLTNYGYSTLDYQSYLDRENRPSNLENLVRADGIYKNMDALKTDGKETHGLFRDNLGDLAGVWRDPDKDGDDITDYTPASHLLGDHPLIDKGEGTRCPAYDFFGNLRLQEAHGCDIGAVAYDDPGEVTNLLVTRNSDGTLNLTYQSACLATDNNLYWRNTPGGDWIGAACGIGNSGSYSTFDPGIGNFKAFVVVAKHRYAEGSYGRSVEQSGAQFTCTERPAFSGAGQCSPLQSVNPANWGCSVRTCP